MPDRPPPPKPRRRRKPKPPPKPPHPIPAPAANGHTDHSQGGAAAGMHAGGEQLLTGDRIIRRAGEWLIPELIPRDEVTLLAGPTGSGKSVLYAAAMAQVTTGAPVLLGAVAAPGRVLVYCREADIHGRAADQWEAAGVAWQRLTAGDETVAGKPAAVPHLPERAQQLDDAIRRTGATLCVLDPIRSYLSPGVSGKEDGPVRVVVETLQQIARRRGCAILLIVHPRKGTTGDPLEWISGSREWSQVPRHIILLGRDPADRQRRILCVRKSAIAGEPPSRLFALQPKPPGVVFVIGDQCGTAAEDMAGEAGDEVQRSAREQARQYLRGLLDAGEVEQRKLVTIMIAEGISWSTVRRAQLDLGIRPALEGGYGEQRWIWRRPERWPGETPK